VNFISDIPDPDKTAAYTLRHGGHFTRDEGMCLLEAVAFLAGEPHSDAPECACPVLSAYGRKLNDVMGKGPAGDALRAKYLSDIAPMLVGTFASTHEVERRRAYLLTDRAVRVIAPMALDAAGLCAHAATLRALAPVTDAFTARAATLAARAATLAARAAAYAAEAAEAAAWAAAEAAEPARADHAAYAAAEAAYAVCVATRVADPDTVRSAARQALIDAINLDTDTEGM